MRADGQALRGSIILTLALLWSCSLAVGRELLLDPEQSRVRFSIPVLWLFEREGDFPDLRLRVDIDESTGLADIEARVQVASARMDNPADVETLKSRDYFDALNHPEIRFTAHAVPVAVLRQGGELAGQLSLRGVTRELRFQLTAEPCGVLPGDADPAGEPAERGPHYCPFELVGAIHRHDYGMSARRGILGDEVSVSIRLVPNVAPNPADAATLATRAEAQH
ncbi:MAG: YceI family protein [Xanthomonadales bacterium]|jgi:polyisoprenoid-binding protein YceI|nr:YceI family protein [Xanthomonadales bacterium]